MLLVCLGLSPQTQAVVPAPDGGYPGANTAEGQNALFSLTTGGFNTAVGYLSLRSNTTSSLNTAVGAGALLANTDGNNNTATGAGALLSNTIGVANTADGEFALFSNTEGGVNTALGDEALFSNTTGDLNTAMGGGALFLNTTGNDNTATGRSALSHNTTGGDNTANGYNALLNNNTGIVNTAIGTGALAGNTTGNSNTALGVLAGSNLTTGDNNIDIGFNVVGVAGESNTIRIGNTDITDTFVRGISGATASGGTAVFVNGNGKLGTMTSSERFKDEIKPIDKASEVILALRPVSFRYKKEIDPQGIPQFGLIAEEVEKVNPDLIIRDAAGKPQTVRYEQINAMLLNEFLKEHRKVQELEAKVTKQQKDSEASSAKQRDQIQGLIARLDAQAGEIQRVSAQLELSKSRSQTALNNP